MKRAISNLVFFSFLISLLVTNSYAVSESKYLSGKEFASIVAERFFDYSGSDPINFLFEQDALTGAEKTFLEKNNATRQVAWRVTLPLAGIYPLPAAFFPELCPDTTDASSIYADATVAVLLTGLVNKDDKTPGTYPIRAEELNSLLERLKSGNYTFLPAISFDMPVSVSSDVDAVNWMGRNDAYEGINLIPTKYLDAFNANGWSIKYVGCFDENGNRIKWGGLCDYSAKTISLQNRTGGTLCHEFGHFISHCTGIDRFLPALFKLEAAKVEPLIGSYCRQSPAEFFGDFFEAWLYTPELRPYLMKVAPNTSHLIQDALLDAEGLVDFELASKITDKAY